MYVKHLPLTRPWSALRLWAYVLLVLVVAADLPLAGQQEAALRAPLLPAVQRLRLGELQPFIQAHLSAEYRLSLILAPGLDHEPWAGVSLEGERPLTQAAVLDRVCAAAQVAWRAVDGRVLIDRPMDGGRRAELMLAMGRGDTAAAATLLAAGDILAEAAVLRAWLSNPELGAVLDRRWQRWALFAWQLGQLPETPLSWALRHDRALIQALNERLQHQPGDLSGWQISLIGSLGLQGETARLQRVIAAAPPAHEALVPLRLAQAARAAALRSLLDLGAVTELLDIARTAQDPQVKTMALLALARQDDDAALAFLAETLPALSQSLRLQIFDALTEAAGPARSAMLRVLWHQAAADERADLAIRLVRVLEPGERSELLRSGDPHLRRELARLGDETAVAEILKTLTGQLVRLRERQALIEALADAEALALSQRPEAVELLVELSGRLAPVLESLRLRALAETRRPEATTSLLPLVADRSHPQREMAVALLARLRDPAVLPDLLALLDDPDPRIRHAAIRALRRMGHPEAGPALLRRLAKAPDEERGEILAALAHCDHIDSDADLLLELDHADDASRRAALAALRQRLGRRWYDPRLGEVLLAKTIARLPLEADESIRLELIALAAPLAATDPQHIPVLRAVTPAGEPADRLDNWLGPLAPDDRRTM